MGYDKEIEAIAIAHELDLFTSPYVFDPEQATAMAEAGADQLVAHVGLTTAGTIGAGVALTLDEVDRAGAWRSRRPAAGSAATSSSSATAGRSTSRPRSARRSPGCRASHGFFGAELHRAPAHGARDPRPGGGLQAAHGRASVATAGPTAQAAADCRAGSLPATDGVRGNGRLAATLPATQRPGAWQTRRAPLDAATNRRVRRRPVTPGLARLSPVAGRQSAGPSEVHELVGQRSIARHGPSPWLRARWARMPSVTGRNACGHRTDGDQPVATCPPAARPRRGTATWRPSSTHATPLSATPVSAMGGRSSGSPGT